MGGEFRQCDGAVFPAARDSCAIAGDDSNCNGVANEGCRCIDGEIQACGGSDVGNCQLGTQTCANGTFQQCVGAVSPGPRNCASPQDNDCNGQPDNTIDGVCQCVIGTTQACGTHPQDGTGPCRAGEQRCNAGPNNSSSAFGSCTGSVGPAQQDSCSVDGDDANCNGDENDRCQCIGQDNSQCAGNPNASRCNGNGQCVACQTDGDCSLVSAGRGACNNGACIVPTVAEEPFECGLVQPPILPAPPIISFPTPNGAPSPEGGAILDGRYSGTSVANYGADGIFLEAMDFEFRGRFVKRQYTGFVSVDGTTPIAAYEAIGTYEVNGTSLVINESSCPGAGVVTNRDFSTPLILTYSADETGLLLFEPFPNGAVVVTTHARQ